MERQRGSARGPGGIEQEFINVLAEVQLELGLDRLPQDEEEQYQVMCGNDCGTQLSIDTPIMCYSGLEEELTLCDTCYWEAGFWEDDTNPDNEDEIKDYKAAAEADDPG